MNRASRPRLTAYDVIVVGGRVGGALAATLFARAGLQVLVVDRASFPSPTLSTHFFRGGSMLRVLELSGLLTDVEALGAPRLTREYSYADGTSTVTVGPPQDPGALGYCMSVRREPLDWVMLDGGLEVLAGLVVGADGRRSTVAEQVAATDRERHAGKRALCYRYVIDMPGPGGGPPDGPEFSGLGDELAYVFPSDARRSCVAVSVNLAEYARLRNDARSRFGDLLRRHRGLWPRYEVSRLDGRLYGSGPMPDYVRQAAGPGWALVGDSGIHQDPWSGVGMDSAAVTAELLVRTHVEAGGVVRGRRHSSRDATNSCSTGSTSLSRGPRTCQHSPDFPQRVSPPSE